MRALPIAFALAASPALAVDCYIDVPVAPAAKPKAVAKPKPRPAPPQAGQAVAQDRPKPRPVAKPRPKPAEALAAPQTVRQRVDCGPTPPKPADQVVERVAASPVAPASSLLEGVGGGGTGSGLRLDALAPAPSAPAVGLPTFAGMFPPGSFAGGPGAPTIVTIVQAPPRDDQPPRRDDPTPPRDDVPHGQVPVPGTLPLLALGLVPLVPLLRRGRK